MRGLRVVILFVLCALGSRGAIAAFALAEIFGDGMVLQQRVAAPIWGWARPQERVTVTPSWTLDGRAVALETWADEAGRWRVAVPTPAAGGPHTVRVVAGGEERTLRDVLIGEVWLCGGQSNMEWPLRIVLGGAEAIREAADPSLRFFVVPNAASVRPRTTFLLPPRGWEPCTPASAAEFSAVGYHFGRMLREALGVPVGLIQADWGGTAIESWMPRSALERHRHVASALELLAAIDPDPALRAERMKGVRGRLAESWWSRLDALPGGAGASWAQERFDDSEWRPFELPATFAGDGLERFDGVVYLRRIVTVPAAVANAEAIIELGPIDDRDELFVNGVLVGGTREDGEWATPRRYAIPGGLLREGDNLIAIRVLDTGGPGGVNGRPEQMLLRRAAGGDAVPLAGEWRLRRGAAMADIPPFDPAPPIGPGTPTALYNGMIAPLVPFALRGAIWYQGESNRSAPGRYASLFRDLIGAWRDRFGDEITFHFVQIAPYSYAGDRGETAELRDAQAAALSLPGTGMVVTLDLGDPNDIHPAAKRAVGERLAGLALSETYAPIGLVGPGGAPLARSPRFSEATIEDGALRVHFDDVRDGLVGAAGDLPGFAIAGPDRRFFEADAVIEGESVVVSSPFVDEPVAVRYAWSAAPRAWLFSGGGLPAAPFRSDDWERPAEGWPVPLDGGRTRWATTDPEELAQFVPLFNGVDLAGWVNINCGAETFTVRDGVIHCTGRPTCLLRSERMYENFVLDLEWRHLEAKGNAGLFVWSDALTAPGTPFARAVEVQVMVGSEADWYTSEGDVFAIHGATLTPLTARVGLHAGKAAPMRAYPTEARTRPGGEWNHYRVICDRGAISLAVNGAVVTRAGEASPRKGFICLESEGTPIEFRNIAIRELPPVEPPLAPEQIALAADGWRPLYGGVDLAGWKHDASTLRRWRPADWVLRHEGGGGDLWTEEEFEDFELIVDWRLPRAAVEREWPLLDARGSERRGPDGEVLAQRVADAGDSGIYLRGSTAAQANIWCWPAGSGEVWGYRTDASMPEDVRAACTPRERADNPPGAWNRFHITLLGDRLTVVLNGRTVIEDAQLPGIPPRGPVGLQDHGDPVEFANIMVRPRLSGVQR
ncbi:MAG TPA: DUF1080 domain-containing protein [Phycisphaerales bacterium]|nr:DUF1080 domain-containing protein [Phycisphaerales bacterium]HMP36275.1 DUF1080 domain-containing protein [Phycisphaerales bacterium]